MIALPAPRPDRRLDPFAFPSETRGRFGMLLIAVLLVGINAGSLLIMKIDGPDFARRMIDFAGRAGEVTRHRDPRELSPDQILELSEKLPPLAGEMLRSQAPRLIIPMLFGLFLLGLAWLLYVRHPHRIRRSHRSQPMIAEQAPTVISFLQHCARALGVPPPDVLRQGKTLAEAARKARLEAREKGNAMWAAYSLYAHPNARVRLPDLPLL